MLLLTLPRWTLQTFKKTTITWAECKPSPTIINKETDGVKKPKQPTRTGDMGLTLYSVESTYVMYLRIDLQ